MANMTDIDVLKGAIEDMSVLVFSIEARWTIPTMRHFGGNK